MHTQFNVKRRRVEWLKQWNFIQKLLFLVVFLTLSHTHAQCTLSVCQSLPLSRSLFLWRYNATALLQMCVIRVRCDCLLMSLASQYFISTVLLINFSHVVVYRLLIQCMAIDCLWMARHVCVCVRAYCLPANVCNGYQIRAKCVCILQLNERQQRLTCVKQHEQWT